MEKTSCFVLFGATSFGMSDCGLCVFVEVVWSAECNLVLFEKKCSRNWRGAALLYVKVQYILKLTDHETNALNFCFGISRLIVTNF